MAKKNVMEEIVAIETDEMELKKRSMLIRKTLRRKLEIREKNSTIIHLAICLSFEMNFFFLNKKSIALKCLRS